MRDAELRQQLRKAREQAWPVATRTGLHLNAFFLALILIVGLFLQRDEDDHRLAWLAVPCGAVWCFCLLAEVTVLSLDRT
eukprot:14754469-Heterocapsa_arctica.AAC.1